MAFENIIEQGEHAGKSFSKIMFSIIKKTHKKSQILKFEQCLFCGLLLMSE